MLVVAFCPMLLKKVEVCDATKFKQGLKAGYIKWLFMRCFPYIRSTLKPVCPQIRERIELHDS